jgi:hypothetical protein
MPSREVIITLSREAAEALGANLTSALNFCEPHDMEPLLGAECAVIASRLTTFLDSSEERSQERPCGSVGEMCADCGDPNFLAWWASPETWKRLNGSHDGVLCPSCFADRAEKDGTKLYWLAKVPGETEPTEAENAEREYQLRRLAEEGAERLDTLLSVAKQWRNTPRFGDAAKRAENDLMAVIDSLSDRSETSEGLEE